MSSARAAKTIRRTVEEPESTTASDRPEVLNFDFNGKRPAASKGPVSAEEASTIKETIIRWLEEQL